ncbi:hypothetical protein [Calderihabitans maritimus]|uniref:Uncharacterized protein n=1 Tax=Calderihabitans maritimus TaxID=1246530 RepID=A0A1Z5HVX6_9FIRM|nr:hypothetical protein [Calderihabitans maritimus]GAW93699.1 hypothetical protein KKC1_28270 [Calderihabitans maritimus]
MFFRITPGVSPPETPEPDSTVHPEISPPEFPNNPERVELPPEREDFLFLIL